jgi:endopeptidase La
MNRINDSYRNNLISKHKYNIHLQNLENIVSQYDSVSNLFNIHIDKVKLKRAKLDTVLSKLKILSLNIGANDIFDIIYLCSGINANYYYNSNDIIFFINETFKPHNYKIIDTIDSETITYHALKSPTTLISHINGCQICIPIIHKNITLMIDGYFIDDPLNILRIKGPLNDKNNKLIEKLKTLDINKAFKMGYINQLTLRDFILNDILILIDNCKMSYYKIIKLKDKTISSLVKEFLNMPIEQQRDFLTLFLLMKDDIETQYLAYLMYDMISNESYLLKPQPLAEQVYNSLHWSIQKLFKIAIKKIDVYNKTLSNFKEEDIPYEKRIALLKVSDYVKCKAMDKYKEILNKGNDSASKAQQYLDGLLSIPFGIYSKEYIITFLETFKIEISIFYKSLKGIEDLVGLNGLAGNTGPKSNDIDIYIGKMSKLLEPDIDINNKSSINTAFKVKDLYKIIEKINIILGAKNKIELIGKPKKTILINLIHEKYSTITNNTLKEKIETVFVSKYPIEVVNNYSIIKNKWLDYRNNTKQYINNVEDTLNKAVYGQNEAKNEVKRIIAQWINGEMKGYCLGFEGPPGTGKTTLAKKGISKCLVDANGITRPFAFIPIGGSSNGATLEGHSYTYVGSGWGKIVDVLRETKCMNPIIYIDELDKISNTENGKEIIGILTHMTDATQNDEFFDKYFSGVKIDLSKVLFIFSYNDPNKIDSVLADRIHRIKFKNLSKKEKIHVVNNYLLPEFLETVGFPTNSVHFKDKVIEYIIDNYTFEAGIRKLKQKIFEIIREINLRCFMDQHYAEFPIDITIDIVNEIFSDKPKIILTKIANNSHIGLVNGLYATSTGSGGITIIETFKTPSDSKLSLMITGQQGDVMQESVKCAKTIAWNILPDVIKKKITKEWVDLYTWGIHVHCPEAATPKDGPSAGGAITLAIISLLCNIPVKNTVALTGEIDLNGSIHAIGGLENKIEGAKMAGVKLVLYPEQNQQDIEIIDKTRPEVLQNIIIKPIKNIWDILENCLENNDLKFNRYVI